MTRASWAALAVVIFVVSIAVAERVFPDLAQAFDDANAAGTTEQNFIRTGALFEARPRKSVENGDDVGFLVDNHGRQYVRAEISEPLTAFGEVSVAEMTPLIQLQFPYSVNPRLVTSITEGSGTATVANSLLTIATGTTTDSDVLVSSVKTAKYFPGQGTLIRWTAVYDASVPLGVEAIAGYGNEEDGFFFGYDTEQTDFGIIHRFAGKVEHRTITFTTGAVTASGTITITLDGVATEIEVVSGDSVQAVARAVDAVDFDDWTNQAIGADVVFIANHAEIESSTFSLADTDTTGVAATGGLVQSITGVAPTNTFIPQSDWNADKMNGSNVSGTNPSKMTLNIATGNVYQVQFQWLGFGGIIFKIENENTGRFHTVHQIQYANNNTTPSIQNPTLPMFVHVDNGSTTTNVSVSTSSMAAFTEGVVSTTVSGLQIGLSGSKSGDLTTETSVLAIKNKPIFQGTANRVEWAGKLLTFAATGAGANKATTLRVTVNPILGGDPSFADVATATSVIATDTAGTTLTGGNVVATFSFGKTVEAFVLDLSTFTVDIPPSALVVVSVDLDAGTSDVEVGFILRELH